MTRRGRTIWLFPYALFCVSVEPIGSAFGISVLRLRVRKIRNNRGGIDKRTYPHTHFDDSPCLGS
jgi:hypothetical protein